VFALVPILLAVVAAAAAGVAGSPAGPIAAPDIDVSTNGNWVFFHGDAPRDTVRIVATISGPRQSELRATALVRVLGLWLPGRGYRIAGVPAFYQVSASCPSCNGLTHCEHRLDLAALNRLLASRGGALGRAWLRHTATVEGLSRPDDALAVLDELWRREVADGRFRVRENAIRINSRAVYYHRLDLPDQAPEGTYEVVTWFLANDRVVEVRRDGFELRRTGVTAWLARQAANHGWSFATASLLLVAGVGFILAGRAPHRNPGS